MGLKDWIKSHTQAIFQLVREKNQMQQPLHQLKIGHLALFQGVTSRLSNLCGRVDSFTGNSKELKEFIWIIFDSLRQKAMGVILIELPASFFHLSFS